MSFWNIPSIEPKLAYRWYISFGDRNIESSDGNNALPHWVCKKVTKPSYQIKHTEHKYLGVHRFNYPTHLEWQPITLTLVDVYNFDQKKFKFTKERKDIDPNKTDNISVNNKTGEKTNIGELVDQTITANRSTQLFFYYFLKEAGYIDPNEGIYQDLLARFTQTITKRKMVGAFIGKNEDYAEGRRSDDPNNTYIDQNSWNTLDINEIDEYGVVTEKWKLFNPLITSVKFGELAYETDGVVDISIDLVYDWAELVPMEAESVEGGTFRGKGISEEKKRFNDIVKDEERQKEKIFNEITRRRNELENKLKESQLLLRKNDYLKNQKDIISNTFIEHKKYSNIKELSSGDRNEILRLKKETASEEQLEIINSAQKQIQSNLSDISKQANLSESENLLFIQEQDYKNKNAIEKSKKSRENILKAEYRTESSAEQSRKAEIEYQKTINQINEYETKSDLLSASFSTGEDKNKAEAIELSKRSVLDKKTTEDNKKTHTFVSLKGSGIQDSEAKQIASITSGGAIISKPYKKNK